MSDSESEIFSDATPPPPQVVVSDYYNKNKRRRPTPHVYYNRHTMQMAAARPTQLVPIRIDIEEPNYKLKDSFMWNLNENLITPETFAMICVEDLNLPNQHIGNALQRQIVQQIRSQLDTFRPVVYTDESPRTALQFIMSQPDEPEDGFRSRPRRNDVLQTILIRLDLTLGKYHLKDMFEWDLNSNEVTPEQFAKQLAADLGMTGEFVQLIAQNIREQVLFAQVHPEDAWVPQYPPNETRLRASNLEWEPLYEQLDEEEVERQAKEAERTARRMRRSQRNAITQLNTPTVPFHFERTTA